VFSVRYELNSYLLCRRNVCTCLVNHFINKAVSTHARETLGNRPTVLFAGPLARSKCVSGRSCDRPSRHRFSCFSSLIRNVEMVPKFQVATACFSCSPHGNYAPFLAKSPKLFT
jgi:hypothetical protein